MALKLCVFSLLLLAFHPSCVKGCIVGGKFTYINYNSACGTWNNPNTTSGFFMDECCPADATWPGSPWQQLSVSYHRCGKQFSFKGNTAYGDCPDYQVLSQRLLDDGTGRVGIEHVMKMGSLVLTKTEQWDFDGRTVHITFRARLALEDCPCPGSGTCSPITKLVVMHAVDPDQDHNPFGTHLTDNSVLHGGLMAEAVGPYTCQSMAYGICDRQSEDRVGFSRWSTDPSGGLSYPSSNLADDTMHYQHFENSLDCGDDREFHFFVVWGRCYNEGRRLFAKAHRDFCPCSNLTLDRRPARPHCKGLCPCERLKTRCSCDRCRVSGLPWRRADEAVRAAEAKAIKGRCSGRGRRQIAKAVEAVRGKAVELDADVAGQFEGNANIEDISCTA